MNISKTCNLFIRDAYLYDISACHYNILQKLNIDTSDIEFENKQKRNIQIGLILRDNPKLTSILRDITISTISEYLIRNNVPDSDIIIRQYDGIILKNILQVTTDKYLPLELQSVYQSFLISSNRQMYIATDSRNCSIKGVSHRYPEMDNMLKKIINLNFLNKNSIFRGLQNIKDELYSSEEASLFCIPKDKNHKTVFMKNYGEITISNNLSKNLDTADIDRSVYYDFYIKPFSESICIEFLNERRNGCQRY